MQREMIRRDLVQFDLAVADQDEFFDHSIDTLVRLGYVKESFRPAIKKRESIYPTALPTEPEAVAIPHSDPEHVLTPFIMASRLKPPVEWHEMGRNEAVHPVRFVFMLGFAHDEGHVQLLQMLLKELQHPEFMQSLAAATTADEFYHIVVSMHGLDD